MMMVTIMEMRIVEVIAKMEIMKLRINQDRVKVILQK